MSVATVLIPRANDYDDGQARRDYPLYIPVTDDIKRWPLVWCPECGELGNCGNHTVAADGTMNGSILCRCGWHVFARLLDWDPDASTL